MRVRVRGRGRGRGRGRVRVRVRVDLEDEEHAARHELCGRSLFEQRQQPFQQLAGGGVRQQQQRLLELGRAHLRECLEQVGALAQPEQEQVSDEDGPLARALRQLRVAWLGLGLG